MDSKLNEYSQKVFNYLESKYPNMLVGYTTHPSYQGKNYLKIEFGCPNKSASYNLKLDTEGDEITVSFDKFHCHLDVFQGLDFDKEINTAIDIIHKIKNEELLSVSYYKGTTLLASKSILSEQIELEISTDIPKWIMNECKSVKVVSWLGNLDKELIIKN